MTAVQELVQAYTAHARFEEEQFLPQAQAILSRNGNHMEALGLSLHHRHAPQPMAHIQAWVVRWLASYWGLINMPNQWLWSRPYKWVLKNATVRSQASLAAAAS